MRQLLYPSGLVAGIVVGTGCFRHPIPDHCFNNEGDHTCRERGEERYCNKCLPEGDGCVATRPEDDCYFPGPELESSSTGGIESTSSETTTAPQPTTDPSQGSSGTAPCAGSEDCEDEGSPFCAPDTQECVACDGMPNPDAACAGQSAETPLCVDGRCVACTPDNPAVCDQSQQVCDGGSNACVACTEHAQCSSGACELALDGRGRCFPMGTPVVEVHGNGLRAAVLAVPAGGHGIIVVHPDNYAESVLVDGGKTIALLAASGTPELHGSASGTSPGLRVHGDGTAVYVDGLTFSYPPDERLGVVVDGASAWFDRSHIVMNTGGGILATNDATLTLRNCFVGGGNISDRNALEVVGSAATVLYTTLGAGFGDAAALTCSGPSTVVVENSLLLSRSATANEVQCPGAEIDHSAAVHDIDGMNVTLGTMETSWFEGYGVGDFHLSSAHPVSIDTAAQRHANDPLTDIDGDPRPTTPGANDFAGADLP